MMFLYPLMLEAYKGIDFRPLLKSNLDGIEPNLFIKLLAQRIFKKGILSCLFTLCYTKKYFKKEILQKQKLDLK